MKSEAERLRGGIAPLCIRARWSLAPIILRESTVRLDGNWHSEGTREFRSRLRLYPFWSFHFSQGSKDHESWPRSLSTSYRHTFAKLIIGHSADYPFES